MPKPNPVLLLILLALIAAPVLAQPSVTITGPTNVVSYDTCTNESWSCSATGGATPYQWYTWKVNGVVKSEGASATNFSKQYCRPGEGVPAVFNDTIQCLVTDSDGRDGSASINVTVTFP